ncbi:MAG: universal stress protein [Phycisphaerae bacterium]
MYKHILIPLENSPVDEVILRHIRDLARMTGARITVIHVAEGYVARSQKSLNLEDSEEMHKDRAYLERRRAELAAEGFDVSTVLACGEPADEVLAFAEREGCDLIAMSTHGHRFLADIVLGSVADSIRHRTNIPVLLVRAPKDPGT